MCAYFFGVGAQADAFARTRKSRGLFEDEAACAARPSSADLTSLRKRRPSKALRFTHAVVRTTKNPSSIEPRFLENIFQT